MGVIRTSQLAAQPQAFSMRDIEGQARAILVRARQQAEQLLAAAQAEADQLKQQARSQGFAEGRTEGLAKGHAEGLAKGIEQALNENSAALSASVGTLTKAMAEIDAQRRDMQAEALREVIELSVAIAERVTKRQGQLDAEVAVANVNEALKLVVHANDVRIAIHPTQRAALESAMPKLRLQWPKLQHVELVDDERLAPGGCRVYSAEGEIDADLNEQLRRVAADLVPDAAEEE